MDGPYTQQKRHKMSFQPLLGIKCVRIHEVPLAKLAFCLRSRLERALGMSSAVLQSFCSMDSMEAEQEGEVIHQNFKDEVLHKINVLRVNKILCNTTIRAEGQDFAAHKCVLSAASEYFRAMFTSQMKETENSLVELHEVKSTTFSAVIHFIYTGKISIDSSNAQDLVVIADYLIIPSLKTKASLFLESTINSSNCLSLESFACQYNCDPLKQVTASYKCVNFVAVVESEEFKELDSEKLKQFICQDEINVSEEEQVYEAVVSWVKHDLSSREFLLPELLTCVRLFSMSEYNLRNILVEELVSKNPACTTMISDALDFTQFPNCYQVRPPKPRFSLEKHILLTGGKDLDGWKKYNLCFVLPTGTWLSLPSMPCYSTDYGGAVCDEKLYILGMLGEKGEDDIFPVMCCFDPEESVWSSNELQLDLIQFSVTCFDKLLYIIGGMNNDFILSTDLYIYNPALDQWRRAASMQTCRASHCAVLLHDHIYVMGGYDNEVCLNSVECYNPSTQQWSNVSSMSKVRMCAASATACEKLVVVGGFADIFEVIEPSCEIFDPKSNEWSLVAGPFNPRAYSSAVTINDVIYLFGGEDDSNYLDAVECYHIKHNTWVFLEKMPSYLAGMQATLIKIPHKFVHNDFNVIGKSHPKGKCDKSELSPV